MPPIPRPNLRRDLPRLIVLSLVFWIGVGAGGPMPFMFRPDPAVTSDAPVTATPTHLGQAEPEVASRWARALCALDAEAYIEAWGEALPAAPDGIRDAFAAARERGRQCLGATHLITASPGPTGQHYAIYLIEWQDETVPPPTRWFSSYVLSIEDGRLVDID